MNEARLRWGKVELWDTAWRVFREREHLSNCWATTSYTAEYVPTLAAFCSFTCGGATLRDSLSAFSILARADILPCFSSSLHKLHFATWNTPATYTLTTEVSRIILSSKPQTYTAFIGVEKAFGRLRRQKFGIAYTRGEYTENWPQSLKICTGRTEIMYVARIWNQQNFRLWTDKKV